jgi:hypothetical protein
MPSVSNSSTTIPDSTTSPSSALGQKVINDQRTRLDHLLATQPQICLTGGVRHLQVTRELGTSNSLVGSCSTQPSTLDIPQHVDGASTLRDTPALSEGLETTCSFRK